MSERDHYELPDHWEAGGPLAHADQDRRILETAALVPEDAASLIDVGCGIGVFLKFLEGARPALALTGLERSDAARERKVCAAELRSGSLEALPLEDGEFDVVSALEVVEHLPVSVYEQGLAEIARVASRYILLSVPYREIRRLMACPSCGCRFDPNYHMRSYDRATVESLFPGFTKVQDRLIHIRVFPVPRVVQSLRARRPVAWRGTARCPQCGYASRPRRSDSPARKPGMTARLRATLERKLPRPGRRAKWIVALYRRGGDTGD